MLCTKLLGPYCYIIRANSSWGSLYHNFFLGNTWHFYSSRTIHKCTGWSLRWKSSIQSYKHKFIFKVDLVFLNVLPGITFLPGPLIQEEAVAFISNTQNCPPYWWLMPQTCTATIRFHLESIRLQRAIRRSNSSKISQCSESFHSSLYLPPTQYLTCCTLKMVIICPPVVWPLTHYSFVLNMVFFIFPKFTGSSSHYNSNTLPRKADLTIHSKAFISHLLRRRGQSRTHHFLWIVKEFRFSAASFVSSREKCYTSTLRHSV